MDIRQQLQNVSYKIKLLPPMLMKYFRSATYQSLVKAIDDKHKTCNTVKRFKEHFGGLSLKDAYMVNEVLPGQIWRTEVIQSILQHVSTTTSIKVPRGQSKYHTLVELRKGKAAQGLSCSLRLLIALSNKILS